MLNVNINILQIAFPSCQKQVTVNLAIKVYIGWLHICYKFKGINLFLLVSSGVGPSVGKDFLLLPVQFFLLLVRQGSLPLGQRVAVPPPPVKKEGISKMQKTY